MFNRTYRRAFGSNTSRLIRFATAIDSKSTELIQLADLLLATACYSLFGEIPLNSPARQAMVDSFHALILENSSTKKGLPKVQFAEWIKPNEFDYESTRHPRSIELKRLRPAFKSEA